METDKHYLMVGSFVLATVVAIALFAVWLGGAYDTHEYKIYRIHFAESVSGLDVGGPVKYRGVQVGKVKAMSIDPSDVRLVQVDISILKTTPIRSDTTASLKLQGITGGVYVELTGSDPNAAPLVQNQNADTPPEIPSEPGSLYALMDMLPQILEKVSHIADQADKLFSDKNIAALSGTLGNLQKASNNAKEATHEIKENPATLLFGNHKKSDQPGDHSPR